MKNDWPADQQNVWKNPDQWGVKPEKPRKKHSESEELITTFLGTVIVALAAILAYIVFVM